MVRASARAHPAERHADVQRAASLLPAPLQALEAVGKKAQLQKQGEEEVKELPAGYSVKDLLGRRQVTYRHDRA